MTPPQTPVERTDLAWQRTGLGLLSVAGLIGYRALATGMSALLIAAGMAGLFGVGVLGVLAPLRNRLVRRRAAAGADVAAPAAVGAVTLAVVLVAVAAGAAVTGLTPR